MADSTKEAEAAQALFCAVVDYEGKKIHPKPRNYRAFARTYERTIQRVRRKVVTPGVTIEGISRFLTEDQDWYDSSVNIANHLLDKTEEIAKNTYNKIKPKGIDLFYVRDDRNTFNSISKLFTYTNNRVKERNRSAPDGDRETDLVFNNLNKWSPADIYLSSKYAQRTLSQLASGSDRAPAPLNKPIVLGQTTIYSRNCFVSFGVLNKLLKTLMESGDLLPLSLKKSPNGQTTIIKTINFIDGDVANALAEQEIGYHGYLYSKSTDIFGAKDIYIKFTNRPKIMMQFRDKASSGGGDNPKWSWQGIITGGTQALDGGLGGGSIGDVLGTISMYGGRFFSFRNIEKIQLDAWDIARDMDEDIEQAIDNPICDQLYNLIVRYRGNNYTNSFTGKLDLFQKLYDNPNFNIGARGITSAGYAARARSQFIYSKYLGGKMIELFENVTEKKANDMVTSMVLYAGSRTNRSSPHWKAADISSF